MAQTTVHMTDDHTFDPETVTIKVGDEVVWASDDETHNAECTDPAFQFNTGPVGPGETSKPIRFTVASTDPAGFLYACTQFHPHMKGHVIVKA